jgi:N-acetylglucosamine-6-phosphate deacetylase
MPSPTEAPLFDLQVNGFAGIDYQQPNLTGENLEHSARGLHRHRMRFNLLTLITDTIDSLESKLRHLEVLRSQSALLKTTFPGYHIEGPYLSPHDGFRGAHRADLMKAPDWDEFQRLQEAANGCIRLITLAPEWAGSDRFIEKVVAAGVTVSLGHTNASNEEIDRAARAGATLCTHLGNGAPGNMHRHDNIIQRLLARDDLIACFIPDGIHVPNYALKNFLRAKPVDKILFTTDAMSAAGAPSGTYQVAHITVEVGDDRVVREPGKDNFAGSSLTLDEGIENVARWTDLSLEQATSMASQRVAEALNMKWPLG